MIRNVKVNCSWVLQIFLDGSGAGEVNNQWCNQLNRKSKIHFMSGQLIQIKLQK